MAIIITTLFLSIKSRARLLNEPHTVANDAEKERLEKSKAKLTWSGSWLINDYSVAKPVSLTRTIGSVEAQRPHVTAEPSVKSERIDDEDYFVILGTRGMW